MIIMTFNKIQCYFSGHIVSPLLPAIEKCELHLVACDRCGKFVQFQGLETIFKNMKVAVYK